MILDCTLRDGGYYVDWDFDHSTVTRYLTAVAMSQVDVIEIGFRFLPANKFLGAFAYSSDEYLKSLNLPANIPIAVMVNASELIKYENGIEVAIDRLFSSKSQSPVDIVRIATSIKNVSECHQIAERLHEHGYRVFLNLMQIDAIDQSELIEISSMISTWGLIEVLYFSDSFGMMDPGLVGEVVATIKRGWFGFIGIHAHDNKGLAIINSLAAYDAGVQYLDSTLSGMGRGAGNAKTECLLVEMMGRNFGEYFPEALFPIISQDFKNLQNKHQWGHNLYYYLSAMHGIHPTYIQEMLGDKRYDVDHILSAINFLKSSSGSSFNIEEMLRATSGIEGNENGSWSATGLLKNRTVLILGAGPSSQKYLETLQVFVKKYRPFVLCLNENNAIPVDMVDAYVACHDTRILIESSVYPSLGKPIILPLSRVPYGIREKLQGTDIFDYGLRIDQAEFQISTNGCVLNSSLALMYAISVATAGGAEKIFMTGIDGYEASSPKQLEMINVLEQYNRRADALRLIAITPTSYPVERYSVFHLL